MRFILCLASIGWLLLSAGCTCKIQASQDNQPAQYTARVDTTSVVTPTNETLTITATPTYSNPAKPVEFVATQTGTTSPTPASKVDQHCLNIQPNLPKGNNFSGTIAFEGEEGVSLYDLQMGVMSNLASEGVFLTTSPDQSLFSYEDLAKNRLEVFSSDGTKIESFIWQEDWMWVERWLDNKNILIVLEKQGEYPEDTKIPPDVLLLNPFTSQTQILNSDYPDIYSDESTTKPWGTSSLTIYSTNLNRVVYPGAIYSDSLEAGIGYILYGIPENAKLAQVSNWYWQSPPQWSPNGDKFVMEGNHEFYVIDYDGQFSQVSNMNPDREAGAEEKYSYYALNYQWSPDNRHVAFWLVTPVSKSYKYTLAVLDTQSGKITDYCIHAARGNKGYTYPNYPIWAPSGKSLLVNSNIGSEQEKVVILVDLENGEAFTLAIDMIPKGWLVSQ